MTTASVEVDLLGEQSQATAIAWWEDMTGKGGEGMVVKPKPFIAKHRRGLAQPAVKSRPGVPAHHLWPRLHGPREPRTAQESRARGKALGRPPRVRDRVVDEHETCESKVVT